IAVFPTNKSSSTKSPPGSTTAMPTTPRPTGNSPPKMLASNSSIYTLQSDRIRRLVADRDYAQSALPKSMQLLGYLTAAGWPDTFLYSSTEIVTDAGCMLFDFQTNQYSFAVDVAVIENVSSKPIQIDQLYGRSEDGKQLRKVAHASQPIAATPLQIEAVTLASSERLIVP